MACCTFFHYIIFNWWCRHIFDGEVSFCWCYLVTTTHFYWTYLHCSANLTTSYFNISIVPVVQLLLQFLVGYLNWILPEEVLRILLGVWLKVFLHIKQRSSACPPKPWGWGGLGLMLQPSDDLLLIRVLLSFKGINNLHLLTLVLRCMRSWVAWCVLCLKYDCAETSRCG